MCNDQQNCDHTKLEVRKIYKSNRYRTKINFCKECFEKEQEKRYKEAWNHAFPNLGLFLNYPIVK